MSSAASLNLVRSQNGVLGYGLARLSRQNDTRVENLVTHFCYITCKGVGRVIIRRVGGNVRVGVNRPSEAQEAASGVWGHVPPEKF